MKLHRFYVDNMDLPHDVWMKDEGLYHQWVRVLRFKPERELALFNKAGKERLYKISKIGTDAVHLEYITDRKPQKPHRKIYLCFALLKKDKNEWVLQKATELGATHFVPILTQRTEKTGFSVERAQKIVIEASEQCGRIDVPKVREPIRLETAIDELGHVATLRVAEQGEKDDTLADSDEPVAVFVGPEGGWTDQEKQLFIDRDIQHVSVSRFTLRAETAAVTTVAHCA